MATQKELVAVVSKEMGVPIETVTVIDRYLAEAGLRTRALRGRGSTAMTYTDAANLIIATAWESHPKDAVSIVSEFGQLAAYRVAEDTSFAADGLGATFSEALANVIESVPEHRDQFSAKDSDPEAMSLRIVMRRPTIEADIVLFKDGRNHTYEFRRPWERERDKTGSGDLRRTAEFSQITLGFVGDAIAEGFPK